MIVSLAERFERKYIPEPNSGCWLWMAGIMSNRPRQQYGVIRLNRNSIGIAHRVSYELFCAPIPEGMHVLHRCDNTYCVNPEHLSLGTHEDNMRDMKLKKRYRYSRGVANGRQKLTEDQVRAIRADSRSGRKIAPDYNISQSVVSDVKSGKRWSHVL